MEIIKKDDEDLDQKKYNERQNMFFTYHSNSIFNNKKNFYSSFQNIRRLDSENKKYYKQIYSAGILPFSIKNGTVYFLLGKDPELKWSDFGGRSEIHDRGRWDTTASREFYEETVGSVMNIQTINNKLNHCKNFIRVNGKTLNGSSYYMYALKIPYSDSYRENFQKMIEFLNYTGNTDKKYLEKMDIMWVSLETILGSMDENNSDVLNFQLRKVFKKTLVDNFDELIEFAKSFISET